MLVTGILAVRTNLQTDRGIKLAFKIIFNFNCLEYEVEECVQILRTRESRLNLFPCKEREREEEEIEQEGKNEREINASFSPQLHITRREVERKRGESKFFSTVIPWWCNEDIRVAKPDCRGNGETQRCGFTPTSGGSQRYCTPRIETSIVLDIHSEIKRAIEYQAGLKKIWVFSLSRSWKKYNILTWGFSLRWPLQTSVLLSPGPGF